MRLPSLATISFSCLILLLLGQSIAVASTDGSSQEHTVDFASTNMTANVTATLHPPLLLVDRAILSKCEPEGDVVSPWYNSVSDGPYKCKSAMPEWPWTMLNAFRWGGTEGVHWKYTTNRNDPACLFNFKIYSADGQRLVATATGRTTTFGLKKRWCALPVYRSGGVEFKQWEGCTCKVFS